MYGVDIASPLRKAPSSRPCSVIGQGDNAFVLLFLYYYGAETGRFLRLTLFEVTFGCNHRYSESALLRNLG